MDSIHRTYGRRYTTTAQNDKKSGALLCCARPVAFASIRMSLREALAAYDADADASLSFSEFCEFVRARRTSGG